MIVPLEELRARARERVRIFHVSLVGITPLDEHRYVGGASLVIINNVPGLLTADHVWEAILNGGFSKVAFGGTKEFAAPGMLISECRVVHRESPVVPDDGFGPDLTFIWLPEPYVDGLCSAGKKIFNLTGSREPAVNAAPTEAGAQRAIFGVPAETTSTFQAEEASGPVTRMAIGTHTFVSDVLALHPVKGWGYFDAALEQRGPTDAATMWGMSGSGVWSVGAGLTIPFLDGVVVRWNPKAKPDFLRCHDRNSIYKFVDEVVPKLADYTESSGYT